MHPISAPWFETLPQFHLLSQLNCPMCFAGLARTLFMEDRSAYGTSIDLCPSGGLPTTAQLQGLAQVSSEYAVTLRAGRAYSLRLMPAAEPLPRPHVVSSHHTAIVPGGAKVRRPTS